LADPHFAATLGYLRGPAFRESLLEHPGYYGTDAGTVATPNEAFGPGAG
jgi:hypothetical protein